MDQQQINTALAEIKADQDPTTKAARLASLCSALFRERGIELVVVGGSAIELLTDGAYTSGDVDLCLLEPTRLSLRDRQELMGSLNAEGGPRSWEISGMFLDLLGPLETLAKTRLRRIDGPYGLVQIAPPEELLVERVLISVYPQEYRPARDCARLLIGVSLRRQLQMDWAEVRRLAELPEYRIFRQCQQLVREVAYELKIKSPLDSNR